jgi:acyl-CoA synthetase (AMP-forming)/AMP-acid ligase II
VLGQAIVVVATARDATQLDTDALLAQCRERLPAFMVPARVIPHQGSLPRNPNGKIDRKSMAQGLQGLFEPNP